jgi:hypothetical protein
MTEAEVDDHLGAGEALEEHDFGELTAQTA